MISHWSKIGLISLLFPLVISCDSDSNSTPPNKLVPETSQTKYLYISTNDIRGNRVVGLTIDTNGQLNEFNSYDTLGVGDADDGDFDAQGAMRIIGDYLLVVNAGETTNDAAIKEGNGSISVFNIDPDTGELDLIDQNSELSGIQNIDSGGVRPVSLDIAEIDGKYWVVVGNQQDGSICVTPSAQNDLATCVDQYNRPVSDFLNDGNDEQRSVNLFQFNNGKLSFVSNIDSYSAEISGAAQISFSPDKSKLAVTTLGIGYDAFGSDQLQLQTPAHTFIYDITSTDNGELAFDNRHYFANPKIAFSIGFSWSPNSRFLYVSNAILQGDATNAEVMTLDTHDKSSVFTSNGQSIPTAIGMISNNTDHATCWTWITPTGDRLYAIAANTNLIASFNVGNNGALTLEHTTSRQMAFEPESTDIFVTADQKHMYVVANVGTFSIAMFDVDENGQLLEKTNSPLTIEASRENTQLPDASKEFYLGIAGYPNYYSGF